MTNVLTPLAPTLFTAARDVQNEPWGVVGAINTDFDDKGVAVGDAVSVDVAPVRAASNFTPANVPSQGASATAQKIDVTITKSRKVDWHLTGEQIRSLENGGIREDWVRQLVLQGMRTLRNEAEVDAALAAKLGASRAFGTSGTTPFVSDLQALTNARKIMVDNGAPMAEASMVFDTNAGLNLRNLGIFQQMQQQGSEQPRRTGNFGQEMGFTLLESAGIGLHTAGTASGATTNNAGYAVGSTVLTLASAGTGTILAGDVITLATDPNKYVVVSGDTDVSNGGTITIAEPGLRVAIPTATRAITMNTSYTANLFFEKSAIVGVMRPPLMPANPTITQQLVSDARGMTYLMLDIAQYGQRTWELHLAWGFRTINTFASGILQG
jgi:hypothetical protein